MSAACNVPSILWTIESWRNSYYRSWAPNELLDFRHILTDAYAITGQIESLTSVASMHQDARCLFDVLHFSTDSRQA